MREENRPILSDEVVEADWTIGGLGFEVGSRRSQTETEEFSKTKRPKVEKSGFFFFFFFFFLNLRSAFLIGHCGYVERVDSVQ